MSIQRREFLSLGLSSLGFIFGSQIFFGSKVSAAVVKNFQESDAAKFLAELPEFEGIYIFKPEGLIPFAEDFGHFIHKTPLGVLRPANSNDIQKLVRFCNANEIKVTMRGTGGAAYGQTQWAGGVVIDSSTLKSISWLSDTLVELEPGLIWTEVLNFTIQKKRAVPVMPDTIVTSVGGKANVGGIGETSYNLGAITDQIVEFDIILADGSCKTCNQKLNAELFTSALGSMGQFGLMVRIVMQTIPAPEKVFSRQFKYDGKNYAFLKDLEIFCREEKNGALAGHFVRNSDGKTFTYVLDCTTWSEENPPWLARFSTTQTGPTKFWNFFEYSNRNTKGWLDAVASGAARLPHPYLSFFIPYENSQEMSDFLQSTELANLGAARIMMTPLMNQNFKSTAFQLPKSDWTAHFRIYRVVRNGENGSDHLKMLEFNQRVIVPKIFELGGKVYLPFSPLLSQEQQKLHFGDEWMSRLALLKQVLDPTHMLNEGAGLL